MGLGELLEDSKHKRDLWDQIGRKKNDSLKLSLNGISDTPKPGSWFLI